MPGTAVSRMASTLVMWKGGRGDLSGSRQRGVVGGPARHLRRARRAVPVPVPVLQDSRRRMARHERRGARRWPAAAVVAAVFLPTLAAGAPAWGSGRLGAVTGQIDLSGGPARGHVPAVAGTVTLSRGGRVYARAALGDGERFRFELPPGT